MKVELNSDLYSELDTYSKVTNAHRDEGGFRDEFGRSQFVGKMEELPKNILHHFPWAGHDPGQDIPNAGGLLATSLVSKLVHNSRAISTYGHVIHVPQFGTVSIGSFTISGKARRLTMLQIDLGCAACGTLSACSGETNGQPMPPPVSRGN